MNRIRTAIIVALVLIAQMAKAQSDEIIVGGAFFVAGAMIHSSELFEGNSDNPKHLKMKRSYGMILGAIGTGLITYGIFKKGYFQASTNSVKLVLKF